MHHTAGKGNPGTDSTTQALNSFESRAGFYAQALGKTPDLSKAFSGASDDVKKKITSGYQDITSGGEIKRLIASGVPADKAVIQSAVNKAAYEGVLDQKSIDAGSSQFNDTLAGMGAAALLDGKSPDQLLKALGVSNNSDQSTPGSLLNFVQQHIDDLVPGNPKPDPSVAADITIVARAVLDKMRHGVGFDSAMKDVTAKWKSVVPGPVTDAYKAGVMHGASALLLGAGLIAKAANGTSGTPLTTAGQALQVGGLLAQGGGKFYGSTLSALKDRIATYERLLDSNGGGASRGDLEAGLDRTKAELTKLTNVGKDAEAIGETVGGVIGNALGFIAGIQSAKAAADGGDKAGAGVQGTLAGLSGISTVASAGEVATYLAPRLATALGSGLSPDLAAGLGIASGVFGAVGAAVGGIAAVGGMLYAIITDFSAATKKNQQRYD